MWKEKDEMMELLSNLGDCNSAWPHECPLCKEKHAHALLHRSMPDSDFGTAWLWCDACGSYSHFSYRIPEWWKNPSFIDNEKLDSFVDYPNSLRDLSDKWLRELQIDMPSNEQTAMF